MTDHSEIDLLFGGHANAICCHRIGDYIVDPGPGSCTPELLEKLGDWRPRGILVTHPHLDHAGGVGALVRQWPDAEVWIHPNGAGLLVDPTELRAAANFIYGDATTELLGEIVPVPEDRIVLVDEGDVREGFRVTYTRGHADHHVCFLHEDTGLAFAGDVASTRIGDGPVIPATPPGFDLELWLQSLEKLRAWTPTALAVTHFGTFADVDEHLDEMAAALHHWLARAPLTTDAQFQAEVLKAGGDHPYAFGLPMASLHAGLESYERSQPDRA